MKGKNPEDIGHLLENILFLILSKHWLCRNSNSNSCLSLHCIHRETTGFMSLRKIKAAVLSGNGKTCNWAYYHHNAYRSVKKLCFSPLCVILTTASIICTNSSERKEGMPILQSSWVCTCTFMLTKSLHEALSLLWLASAPLLLWILTFFSSLTENFNFFLCANTYDLLKTLSDILCFQNTLCLWSFSPVSPGQYLDQLVSMHFRRNFRFYYVKTVS